MLQNKCILFIKVTIVYYPSVSLFTTYYIVEIDR